MSKFGKRASTRSCAKCNFRGKETFWYMQHRYLFDVDHARQLVADGREAVELEPDDVRFSVKTSTLYRHHVPHVVPTIPGIISYIYFPNDDGEIIRGHVLIDGHHRAARCLDLRRPFHVHLLTEDESRAILLRSPELAFATV